ncbi:hypothetical protein IOD16_26120 [Saccharothrix sp. 6-C]|uniref:hypothetical protein n=1 Tax=Saccharothrix sp. 6-C TaxID=2781735 RepID=UPI0019175844|nr:hypothetical protein [Saccharothrix sp. 6-C]QQQ74613.1 hypothetical protein IOD16_26120 [Saccharothrix sp. 6-C]
MVRLNPWSRGFGTAAAFAVLPAFFGVLLPARADGDVLALVGGILLTAPAAGLLARGWWRCGSGNPRPGGRST